jgi:hypothetical protein
MEKSYNPDSSDPREKIIQKLNQYSKFFFSPLLPEQTGLNDLNSKEILMQALKKQNHKGKKLIKLTKDFHSMCENLHKEMINLESKNFSQISKIRQLESQIVLTELKSKETLKKLTENEESIQEYREIFDSLTEEKDNISIEFDTFKQEMKSAEEKYLNRIQEIQTKHLKEKEEFLKKIEKLEKNADKSLEFSENSEKIVEKYEQKLIGEKIQNEKYRNDINLLKIQVKELEANLDELKIKKSQYKERCLQIKVGLVKNNSTQTSNQLEESFSQIQLGEISGNDSQSFANENDLKLLEDEQSLAQSEVIFSLGANDISLNDYKNCSEAKSENKILVFPKKPEEKYRIVSVNSFSFTPKAKSLNFSISRTQNYSIRPEKRFQEAESGSIIYAFPASKLKKSPTGEYLFPKALSSHRIVSSLQTSPRSLFLSPKNLQTQNVGFFSINPAEEVKIQHHDLKGNQKEKIIDGREYSAPDDPIKDYFVKLCQVIKAKCNYNEKINRIPTGKLFHNLMKNKVPLYRWPDTIQLYLAKRVNDE